MSVRKEKVIINNKSINYVCLMDECPVSCCGPFGGVQSGIDSIYETNFAEITLTTMDSNRIISEGFSYFIELTTFGHYRMKLEDNGACSAFIDGRCSMHSVKPSICRAFPFYIDMFVGLCVVSGSCPGVGVGWTELSDLKSEISATKEIYNFWINEYDK